MKQSAEVSGAAVLLADVALFVEIARTESFSRAAARLGIPAPTLSRRIAAMERRIGVQLFQRTTRKVALTPVAGPYYERCLEVMAAAAAAQDALERSRTMQERIRIAMPVDLGVAVLGPIIARFVAASPGLRVEFDLSSRTADLFSDPVDLAFRIGKITDDRVVARRIGTIQSGVFAAPAYLQRHGPIDSPMQLENASCLNLQTSSGAMPWVIGPHKWPGAPGPCVISANSVSLLRALAEDGQGVALLPRHVAHHSVLSGRLVPILEAEKTPAWPLFAVTGSRMISKGMRLMIAHVSNELKQITTQTL
ncbi:MAG TPA: LysR family transcriptional regulator [Nitrospira sp.]|nr:LysR family transcriptional regulator [Accumulibacter sp.]HMX93544.1 LysR family transcriptional regulator [Nitrospira sp.]HNI73952.1 LysR family transcriptional regulator [Accumulibacter sp.]